MEDLSEVDQQVKGLRSAARLAKNSPPRHDSGHPHGSCVLLLKRPLLTAHPKQESDAIIYVCSAAATFSETLEGAERPLLPATPVVTFRWHQSAHSGPLK